MASSSRASAPASGSPSPEGPAFGEGYLTVRDGAEPQGVYEERKSRFIAQLAHVSGEREAEAFVDEVKARHRDARHNVPVWALSDGRERASDAGEPRGTAGMPVLEVLRGAGLKDVCCVVTRYFGGTLLGAGNLSRAYVEAANRAVAAAQADGSIVRMSLVTKVVCEIPYTLYDRVVRLAADAGGKVRDSVFAEDVQLTLDFLAGDEEAFMAAVRELAAGEELCRAAEPAFRAF